MDVPGTGSQLGSDHSCLPFRKIFLAETEAGRLVFRLRSEEELIRDWVGRPWPCRGRKQEHGRFKCSNFVSDRCFFHLLLRVCMHVCVHFE